MGIAELGDYEGLMLQPYLCTSNVKTVGFGSTISDIPDLPNWAWDKTITVAEAVQYYLKGIKKYEDAVNKALMVAVTQEQFDALVSITYNIGIGGMQKSTFMRLINQNASVDQIVAAMKKFNMGGGKVVQGLINRRNKEGKLFKEGTYSSNGYVDLIPVNTVTHRPLYKYAKKLNLMPLI